jgi:hypothetical protein
MGGKLTIKNNDNTEFTIEHKDGSNAKSIVSKDISIAVDTINDFPSSPNDGDVVVVRDLDRGGTFIYDSSKVAEHNDGTNFNGWIRQFSGPVNVKWFGAKGDGVTDDTDAIQNALNLFDIVLDKNKTYNVTKLNVLNNIYGYGSTIKIIEDNNIIINSSNITIDSLNINQDIHTGILTITTKDSDVENITISNCNIYHSNQCTKFAHNILIKTYNDYNISNVKIINTKAYFAYGDGNGDGDNLCIASYSSDGSGKVFNIFIDNCIFEECSRNNISIAGTNDSGKPYNINISNTKCLNSALAGIDFEYGDYVTVTNCNFENNGQYNSGDWDSSHILETQPINSMRAGICLHSAYTDTINNCTFNKCFYGISGWSNIKISECVFNDSPIDNGNAAIGVNLYANSCTFLLNNTTYAIKSYNSSSIYENCSFKGNDSTDNFYIHITNGSTSDGEIFQTKFENCNFNGLGKVLQLQYGSVIFNNCIFNKNYSVVENDAGNRLNTVIISNSKFIETTYGVLSGYRWRDKLIFMNNYMYNIKSYGVATNQEGYINISNNTFICNFTDGDGLTHNAIYAYNGIGSGIISNNIFKNVGSATDGVGLYYRAKNTEVLNNSVNILNNIGGDNLDYTLRILDYNNNDNLKFSIAKNNITKAPNADDFTAYTNDSSNVTADNLHIN